MLTISILFIFSYLNDLDRIAQPNYIPTQQDVLRTQWKPQELLRPILLSKIFILSE